MEEANEINVNNNLLLNCSQVNKSPLLIDDENNTLLMDDVLSKENDVNLLNVKENGGDVSRPSSQNINSIFTENNQQIKSKQKIKRSMKRIAVVDSDSENELTDPLTSNDITEEKSFQILNEDDNTGINKSVTNKGKKKPIIYDSDSDGNDNCDTSKNAEDELASESSSNDNSTLKKSIPKRLAIDDSDSEEESISVPEIHKSQNESNIIEEFNPYKSSYLSTLCDSESSEDEQTDQNIHSENSDSTHLISKPRKTKKSNTASVKEELPKKMTAKEAIKQRQEIKSESQRMLREAPLSLPYHKPKERTIKEFLQNRPRLSILKNESNLPVSAAIKMTTEELKVVTKKMEDREKELQVFYKSESEDEDSSERGETPPLEEIGNANSPKSDLCIEIEIRDEGNDENITKAVNMNKETKDLLVEDIDVNIKQNEDVSENNTSLEMDVTFAEETSASIENVADVIHGEAKETDVDISETLSELISEKQEKVDLTNDLSTLPTKKSPTENKIIIHSVISIPNTSNLVEESVDYDFNLDDLDEHVELKNNSEENRLHNLLKKFNHDNTNISSGSSLKQQLLEQLGNCKPSLSGDPDEVIDFDEGVVKPNPVVQLIERYRKHTGTKNVAQSQVQLSIINLSQGEIHKETVAVSVDTNEEEGVEIEPIPGEKLKKLRNELQEQIAKQRTELWKQKNCTMNNKEVAVIGEKTCQYIEDDEDILDDEEEMIDDETTDEEDVLDEINCVEDRKAKSAFVDDEAEDSDADECEEIPSGRSSKMTEQLDDDDSNMNDTASVGIPKKHLKRIVRGFTEDSDDENVDKSNTMPEVANSSNFKAQTTDVWDDDISIPPHQPRSDKTPLKETTESKLETSFHTPILQLTGLQGLNSGSKFLHESPLSPFHFPVSTPAECLGAKQKLFADTCDPMQSEDMDDIAKLCSGEFPSSNNSEKGQNVDTTTQDLLSICSGEFTGITNNKLNNNSDENIVLTDEAGASNQNVPFDSDTSNAIANTVTDSKYLDDDRIISQLLDEEELEKFKKKFESPIAMTTKLEENDLEIKGGGKLIFDSSDDEAEDNHPKIAKTSHKKLEFSDDESEEEFNNEEIDLHDNEEDEEESNCIEVDYDSEENEVEHDLEPKEKHKPSDFFEKEAELSESDWDSADEDEKDLDALEVEQGDADVFDDNKIRRDLEKIHMRRVLDQDNREIKILQELLLEDGELHGTGRQRQFRWRNIDDAANDERGPIDAEEIYLEEDEDESEWRRARHQREMFLKSQQDKQNDDDVESIISDSNSQVFKIGQESVRRSLSNSSSHTEKDKPAAVNLNRTNPSIFTNTRGSFLARTDKFLTRLADMTRITTMASVVKTSKKIVFQTNVCENDESSSSNKRKATDGTPVAIKKLRLTSNLSPSMVGSKKKKLF